MASQRRRGVVALALTAVLLASVAARDATADDAAAERHCAAAPSSMEESAGACRSRGETEDAAGFGSCDVAGATGEGGAGSCPSASSGSSDRGDRAGRGPSVDGNPPEGATYKTSTEFLRDRYIVRFNDYRMVRFFVVWGGGVGKGAFACMTIRVLGRARACVHAAVDAFCRGAPRQMRSLT